MGEPLGPVFLSLKIIKIIIIIKKAKTVFIKREHKFGTP